MQGRDADRTVHAEGFKHAPGVDAGGHTLIDDHAAPFIFAHRIGVAQMVEADGQDQVAFGKVFIVEEHGDVRQAAQAGDALAAVEHSCQQGPFVPFDVVDTADEQFAPIAALAELAAQPTNIVDDLGGHLG